MNWSLVASGHVTTCDNELLIGSWSMRKLFTGGNKARSGAMLFPATLK